MTDEKLTPAPEEEPMDMETLLRQEQEREAEDDALRRGSLVEGEVIQVGQDFVFVSLNSKIDGKIPRSEFPSPPALGARLECVVMSLDREAGDLLLSVEEARRHKGWRRVREAMERDGYIEGVVGEVRGDSRMVDVGFPVAVKLFEFNNREDDPETVQGRTLKFKILKAFQKKGLLVLSRKAYLREVREAQRREILSQLQVGRVLKGKVRDVKDYGVFVDLGGIDGLIRRSDLSWNREVKPSDLLKKGDEIEVVVLAVEQVTPEEPPKEEGKPRPPRETIRVSLGYKQLQPDPWEGVADRFRPGMTVRGRVARVFDFGVFIELEPGVDAFAPRSEISWSPQPPNPRKLLKPGDTVEAKVMQVDPAGRKIGVSLKELLPDPWAEVESRYRVGQVVEGKVLRVLERAVILRLDDDFDAFLHVDEVSWEERNPRLSDRFKPGESVRAVIIDVSVRERRIRVSVKRLEPDPWEVFRTEHPEGSLVKATVKEVVPAGLVVALDGGREGFIPLRDIERSKAEALAEHFKPGDAVDAVVLEVNPAERRIRLSQKRSGEALERKEMERMMGESRKAETQTLGEMLNWRLPGGTDRE